MDTKIIVGLAVALGGLWFLVGAVKHRHPEGIALESGIRYHLLYTGPRVTFQTALGECYNMIYTIDVYDPYYGEWIPPVDPTTEYIEPNADCYVEVLGSCTLYNFEPI